MCRFFPDVVRILGLALKHCFPSYVELCWSSFSWWLSLRESLVGRISTLDVNSTTCLGCRSRTDSQLRVLPRAISLYTILLAKEVRAYAKLVVQAIVANANVLHVANNCVSSHQMAENMNCNRSLRSTDGIMHKPRRKRDARSRSQE